MSQEEVAAGAAQAEGTLDPAQALYLRQQLEAEQNLVLGALAGAFASVCCAVLWATVTHVTGYQIGFMAIGVGLGVGYCVRLGGKGIATPFGIVGAAFALLGCALGNLLAVTALVAQHEGIPLLTLLPQLDVEAVGRLLVAFFQPMDLLFYAIAVYEGYRFSFRRLDPGDLQQRLSGGAT